jgi:hypothetical protein
LTEADPFFQLSEGDPLPTLLKSPNYDQLVAWAGASRDRFAIHLNPDVAHEAGLPGVIVHGALKASFMAQLLVEWAGANGTLRELDVEYRGIDQPGQLLTITGTVRRKWVEGARRYIECDVWIENDLGDRTTRGRALVEFSADRGRPVGGDRERQSE